MYAQIHLNNLRNQSLVPPPSVPPPQLAPWVYDHPQNSGLSPSMAPPHGWTSIRTGTNLAGRPIYFRSGPYAGRTIRMELHEIQKADLGRKFASVDRRPLDPPPVVLLKVFEVYHPGTEMEQEEEIESDDVQTLGLVCAVDLFPVPDPEPFTTQVDLDSERTSSTYLTASPRAAMLSSSLPSSPRSYSGYNADPTPVLNNFQQGPKCSPILGIEKTRSLNHIPSSNPFRRNVMESATSSYYGGIPRSPNVGYTMPQDILYHVNDYPIIEQSKQTHHLIGETSVQSDMIQYQGSNALVFVFANLAVRLEGHFFLRYRVFDIFSQPYSDSNDSTVSAVCYGGRFHIYSTKEFPGLSPSTELTKQLALWGVRVNYRVTNRHRGRKPAPKKNKISRIIE